MTDHFFEIHIKHDDKNDAKACLKQMELLGNTAAIALMFSVTPAVSRYCFCLW